MFAVQPQGLNKYHNFLEHFKMEFTTFLMLFCLLVLYHLVDRAISFFFAMGYDAIC